MSNLTTNFKAPFSHPAEYSAEYPGQVAVLEVLELLLNFF